MSFVTISSKYQVVIPREIRSALQLKPGQKISLVRVGQSLYLTPVQKLQDMKGSLKGLPTTGFREKKDRRL